MSEFREVFDLVDRDRGGSIDVKEVGNDFCHPGSCILMSPEHIQPNTQLPLPHSR